MKVVAKAYPRRKLHIVVENYSAHNHADIKKLLAKHPQIELHFTPAHSSWRLLVESFFSIITRQAIRRASFTSVRQVTDPSALSSTPGNQRCIPSAWTKTAEQILTIASRKADSLTDH